MIIPDNRTKASSKPQVGFLPSISQATVFFQQNNIEKNHHGTITWHQKTDGTKLQSELTFHENLT